MRHCWLPVDVAGSRVVACSLVCVHRPAEALCGDSGAGAGRGSSRRRMCISPCSLADLALAEFAHSCELIVASSDAAARQHAAQCGPVPRGERTDLALPWLFGIAATLAAS